MNILRNTATLIIAKHLNIIFKFYISSNTNDIYTSKSAEEIRYFKTNFGHDLHQWLKICLIYTEYKQANNSWAESGFFSYLRLSLKDIYQVPLG